MNFPRSPIFLICLIFASPVFAASTVTVTDPNSDFSVTYDPDEAGLFGRLFLSHNTIFFLPDDFSATSSNGNVGNVVSETLNLQLTATTLGFTFDSFILSETGDYLLNGDNAEVFAHGEMRVRSSEAPLDEFLGSFDFMESGDLGADQWEGLAEINSGSGWTGTDGSDQTTVFLTLQNILNATTSLTGEQAFIQKKFEGISIQVGEVPLPAAVWLFAAAVLTVIRRRRAAPAIQPFSPQ